ncbi:MAG: ornithine carbamoyltransferase [Candidatus Puniceispirillales bacterium]
MTRHFIDIADHDTALLKSMVAEAVAMKTDRSRGKSLLAGRTIALIFEKPSTRTRVSFEVGIHEMGGTPLVLKSDEMQLGRGETVADTARVLSRYVDAIMIRTSRHEIITELAQTASVPVINGLTDKSHPCQVMADVMTMAEIKSPDQDFENLKVAWFGDGNNVANSWVEAAAAFGFALDLAVPPQLKPDGAVVDAAVKAGARIGFHDDSAMAAADADVMVTDTWSSMGMPGGYSNSGQRQDLLRRFQIDQRLMEKAAPEAVFMHCLPVYRGQEATAEVVDGPQSVIWQEAENRLHVQKAIMAWCLGGGKDA